MHHNDDWLAHNGSAYDALENQTIKSEVWTFLRNARQDLGDQKTGPFNPTKAKVGDVIDALKAASHVQREEFAPPCWLRNSGPPAAELVACENGLLHLPTRKLLAPTPDFFTRNALAFSYDSNAPEPQKWLEFLSSIWSADQASINTLQEIFGYLLTNDTAQQKIFLLVGPTRSGKGTIARVLTELVGKKNTCAPSLNNLGDGFGLQPLIGKQVAIVSDMRMSRKTDQAAIAENLLRISGEDLVTADRERSTGSRIRPDKIACGRF